MVKPIEMYIALGILTFGIFDVSTDKRDHPKPQVSEEGQGDAGQDIGHRRIRSWCQQSGIHL